MFGWAGGFGTGLSSITAKPPAALAPDFTIIVAFYTLAGTLTIANTQPLADFVMAHDIDHARIQVWQARGSPMIDGGV